jgi:exonuclease VII large subunit
LLIVTATVALLAGGCVKKSEYQSVVTQLEECKQRSDEYEGLYQQAMEERKQTLVEAMDYLPTAAAELRQELDVKLQEVTAGLDTRVREQVREMLDRMTQQMAQGYRTLSEQNQQLQTQLADARGVLDVVMQKTGAIERTVGEERVAMLRRRESVMGQIDDLSETISTWKYSYVDCKDCDTRLRLNDRERQEISSLTTQLASDLEALRNEFTILSGELEAVMQAEATEGP